MSALDKLMTRLGYVKLGRFGLSLTAEGRILSMRPAALDDGFGGRIVGWEDGDLAAMELEKWQPQAAPQRATASRLAVSPPPVPMRRSVPMPAVVVPSALFVAPVAAAPVPVVVTPPAVRLPGLTPAVAPAPVVAKAPPIVAPVAAAPAEPEEDWEWTIAIARARAAAEEADEAAAKLRVAPRQAAIRAVVQLVPDPPPVRAVPLVMPLRAEPPALRVVPTVAVAVVPPVAAVSRTVIPIPSLPALGDRRLEPVVRPSVTAVVRPPAIASPDRKRFPRGTLDHDTVPRLAPVEASDDDTQTGVAMPPVVLPSIRQRMIR